MKRKLGHPFYSARNMDIYKMYKNGNNYTEISYKYKLTRERIRQIIIRYERKES